MMAMEGRQVRNVGIYAGAVLAVTIAFFVMVSKTKMIEGLFVAIFLFVVLVWRELSKYKKMQKMLHAEEALTPFLEWYSWLFWGLGVFQVRDFCQVLYWDCYKADFLKINYREELLEKKHITLAELQDLEMPIWLRVFSLAAPVAGLVAGGIVMQHVFRLVMASVGRNTRRSNALRWRLSPELRMVLLVVAMPMVFIVMTTRAEIRVWTIITGSLWRNPKLQAMGWAAAKELEMLTYTEDLEVAQFFQFFTIWSFGQLCVSYLENAPVQYREALKWSGLQGVYLYVVFGALNCALVVGSSLTQHYHHGRHAVQSLSSYVGPVFITATLLCILNMKNIGGMEDVQRRLGGSVNMKFNATRVLLIFSVIQPKVFVFLVDLVAAVPTPAAAAVLSSQAFPARMLKGLAAVLDLSDYRAKLLQAALLNFECLLVVALNRCSWQPNFNYEKEVCDDEEEEGPEAAARDPREVGLLSAAE